MTEATKKGFRKKMQKERNINLDIIRSVALLSVICVHFPLYIGFYDQPLIDISNYIISFLITVCKVCVPLFLLLTGYLKSGCSLTKKYYHGIVKIYRAYVLASLVCVVYRKMRQIRGLSYAIADILGFSASNYAWYIAMYIGLFLLIPFLNLAYHNLDTKRNKQLLIMSCLICTAAPSVFNIWSFGKLIPDFWLSFYPITYYFIGAYLKDYPVKIAPLKAGLMFLICTSVFTALNIWFSYPGSFITGVWNEWGSLQATVDAVLLFILLYNLKTDNMPAIIRSAFIWISKLSVYALLVSSTFDHEFYYRGLNVHISEVKERLPYYPLMVVVIFTGSIVLAVLLYFLDKVIVKLFISLVSIVKKGLGKV